MIVTAPSPVRRKKTYVFPALHGGVTANCVVVLDHADHRHESPGIDPFSPFGRILLCRERGAQVVGGTRVYSPVKKKKKTHLAHSDASH